MSISSSFPEGNGLTWLVAAPKIRLLPDTEKRQPHPLTWDEQARLEAHVPRESHRDS